MYKNCYIVGGGLYEGFWAGHGNPWGVWTRYLALPLLILGIWSRVLWGWWAIAPILIVILWIWLNPPLFPKPESSQNWADKAVLGERLWIDRQQIPIREHHNSVIRFTNTVNALGLIICVFGLVNPIIWPTLLGLSWVIIDQTWVLDRMVWLGDQIGDREPYKPSFLLSVFYSVSSTQCMGSSTWLICSWFRSDLRQVPRISWVHLIFTQILKSVG